MFERLVIRAVAFGLSGFVTLSTLAALGATADAQHAQACMAHAASHEAQTVVVGAPHQPRS